MTGMPHPYPSTPAPPPYAAATRLVALGREPRTPGAQVGAPLVLTSTFHANGADVYAREDNPTWRAFEDTLGALEGGEALVVSSGMAAVTAALSLVPPGGVVVAAPVAYMGTTSLLREQADAGRLTLRLVDPTDLDAVATALSGADQVWLESPTNPLLEVVDLASVCRLAASSGVVTVVDNTFATPLRQRPLDLGADVVLHSATKYLSGHSDVVLGALCTRTDAPGQALRERLAHHRHLLGAIAGPVETWLALRGIRTLAVRLDRAEANATELARRLAGHPQVSRVRYPGFSAMLAIETRGSGADAERVAEATRLWVHATSLGGVESQIERRRRYATEPEEVPETLLRLSVGIEDVEDLWRDLAAALDTLGQ